MWVFTALGFDHWLQGLDHWLQGLGITAGLLGCWCSLWALAQAWKTRTLLRDAGINSYRRDGVTMTLETQAGILVVQAILTGVALAVLTLPPVPVAMYTTMPEGPWILAVIFGRKVARLTMTLVLLWVSWRKVRWLLSLPPTEAA